MLAQRNALDAVRAGLVRRQLAAIRVRSARAGALANQRARVASLQHQLASLQAAQAAAARAAAASANAPSAGSSAGAGSGGASAVAGTPAGSSGGFTFPLPKGAASPPGTWSLDQGVDISAPGDTPEFAVCSGTIVLHGIGGFGPWAPVLHCDSSLGGYSYVYYGHAGPANQLPVGTHVGAGSGDELGRPGDRRDVDRAAYRDRLCRRQRHPGRRRQRLDDDVAAPGLVLSRGVGLLRRGVTSLRLRGADLTDRVRGRGDPLVPPRRLNFVGDSDFLATGEEFRGHFHELGGLQPSDRVLDVGCGIGRMARVLASELAPPGSYDGFDVVAAGIEWCRERYGRPGVTRVPFRFTHADLHHPLYNPGGTGSAETYRFPYPDSSFDLVIATSVFTHLLEDAAAHYVAELARVLAPGGRALTTWLLIDPSDPPVAGAASWSFADLGDGAARVADPADPEAAVAYEVGWLLARLNDHGLQLRGPILAGSWRGRHGRSFQDLVVITRA